MRAGDLKRSEFFQGREIWLRTLGVSSTTSFFTITALVTRALVELCPPLYIDSMSPSDESPALSMTGSTMSGSKLSELKSFCRK